MRVAAERLRHALLELGFDLLGGFATREAGAVRDAEHVGVDRESLLAERAVHHHVGGLAADAGQGDQRVAVGRDLAAVLGNQLLGQGDNVLRLGIEQADRLDVLL